MPETTRTDVVRELSLRARTAGDDYKRWIVQRDAGIRYLKAEGASLRLLAEASGLSIAQVQRICDMSKETGR